MKAMSETDIGDGELWERLNLYARYYKHMKEAHDMVEKCGYLTRREIFVDGRRRQIVLLVDNCEDAIGEMEEVDKIND